MRMRLPANLEPVPGALRDFDCCFRHLFVAADEMLSQNRGKAFQVVGQMLLGEGR